MLEVRNLEKTYRGGVRALRGLNLTVAPGMFGLLGPNGAGKSSFMRTLAGLQLPDSGSRSCWSALCAWPARTEPLGTS